MQHLLRTTLPDFTKANILVLGDMMLDRYWFGDVSRVSPEAPVPVVNINNVDHRPGGAGNVALNLKALGATVTLIGVIGEDEAGELLEEQLRASDVTLDLYRLPDLPTIVKLRVISRHQQLLRLDFEKKLMTVDNQWLLHTFKKHLQHANLVILSDYHKGCLQHPEPFIEMARHAKVKVLVDPKNPHFSHYQGVSIITPNFREFERVVGICDNEQMILEKGRQLLSATHIDSLLITRSEQGMTLITHEENFHFPAYAREVLDVTGAGDTVISLLGAAVAADMSLPEATALANLGASIVVGKLGAATVSVPELQVALMSHTTINSGVVTEEQLLIAVKALRAEGKRIVFTNGCFDVLHAGHVLCLQMAKALGDYLIVAVNSDESVRQLKGPHRPINHLAHRLCVLAGLGVVDWVVPFSDATPERLLSLIQPEVLAKGGEYSLNEVVGSEIVKSYGGEVHILGEKITSSTTIINRMNQQTNEKMTQ